jgi:hypothetical protein
MNEGSPHIDLEKVGWGKWVSGYRHGPMHEGNPHFDAVDMRQCLILHPSCASMHVGSRCFPEIHSQLPVAMHLHGEHSKKM